MILRNSTGLNMLDLHWYWYALALPYNLAKHDYSHSDLWLQRLLLPQANGCVTSYVLGGVSAAVPGSGLQAVNMNISNLRRPRTSLPKNRKR